MYYSSARIRILLNDKTDEINSILIMHWCIRHTSDPETKSWILSNNLLLLLKMYVRELQSILPHPNPFPLRLPVWRVISRSASWSSPQGQRWSDQGSHREYVPCPAGKEFISLKIMRNLDLTNSRTALLYDTRMFTTNALIIRSMLTCPSTGLCSNLVTVMFSAPLSVKLEMTSLSLK